MLQLCCTSSEFLKEGNSPKHGRNFQKTSSTSCGGWKSKLWDSLRILSFLKSTLTPLRPGSRTGAAFVTEEVLGDGLWTPSSPSVAPLGRGEQPWRWDTAVARGPGWQMASGRARFCCSWWLPFRQQGCHRDHSYGVDLGRWEERPSAIPRS